jgi:transposase
LRAGDGRDARFPFYVHGVHVAGDHAVIADDEQLAFLRQAARAYPRRRLHIVCDNYGTHNHPDVRAWLAKHPRIILHFTPTSGSWLNLAEVFFSIITRQAIRRGSFTSVKDLIAAIENSIDGVERPLPPLHMDQISRRHTPALPPR